MISMTDGSVNTAAEHTAAAPEGFLSLHAVILLRAVHARRFPFKA